MNGKPTYRAVLFGPNPIASGTELDLEYVDGKYQEIVVIEDVSDDGQTVTRTYRRGHHTAEPISYRFFEEEDHVGSEADVPN